MDKDPSEAGEGQPLIVFYFEASRIEADGTKDEDGPSPPKGGSTI